MARKIKIGNKYIGKNQPVFIIAEAGVNHNGNLKLAKQLIDVAAEAKVDAVKFQTFNPDTLITRGVAKAKYQKQNVGGESQFEMLKRLVLPREWHAGLKKYAEEKGLIFMSTPFSLDDAVYLRKLGIKVLKVGSSDTENIPYLVEIAKWNLPVILSTGMSDLAAVKISVAAMKKAGCRNLVLLHCTTNYPTPFEQANIKAILTLAKELKLPTGFSDHTSGVEASLAAVAIGAIVIEKHFTISKALPGPDQRASLEPPELKLLVNSIRNVEKALGTGKKEPFAIEMEIAKVARKSIVAAKNIKKGEILSKNNLAIKRPGNGLAPKYYHEVIGRVAKKDIAADSLIQKSHYEKK